MWGCSTCSPDILSLDALVKLKILQFIIIPAVTVHMDTPWMDSVEKTYHSQKSEDALKAHSIL